VFASWKAAADRISTICECDEDTYTITPQSLQTNKWAAARKKELETNRAKHKAEKSLAASEYQERIDAGQTLSKLEPDT